MGAARARSPTPCQSASHARHRCWIWDATAGDGAWTTERVFDSTSMTTMGVGLLLLLLLLWLFWFMVVPSSQWVARAVPHPVRVGSSSGGGAARVTTARAGTPGAASRAI